MNLLPYGPRAVLAEFDDIEQVVATAAAWRAAAFPGVIDIVPAATTVLVVHDGTLDPSRLTPVTDRVAAPVGELVRVPVRYDGADLADIAVACGLTVDEVVELHSGTEYTSAFCGFIAGFGYLVGLDERLVVRRRATPRTRVPAGSVAMASTFTGVYPVESPGGWHLLGRTDLPMWVPDRQVPATLPPGSRVRFVPT
jgi:KipI family sensor histidine kinase inhibitor